MKRIRIFVWLGRVAIIELVFSSVLVFVFREGRPSNIVLLPGHPFELNDALL